MASICRAKLIGICIVPDCEHGTIHEQDCRRDDHICHTMGCITRCVPLNKKRVEQFKHINWDEW